jgi:tetratricopeptide (TPR) repeat protein
VLALLTLAAGHVSRDELDAARALVGEMQQLARPHDPPVIVGAPLSILSTIHLRRHELREAAISLQQQRALLSGPDGDVGGLAASELNLCTALNAMGRHDEAVEVANEALARSTAPRSFAGPLAYQKLLALASTRRVEEALALAHAERATLERTGSVFRYGAEALATIALARGRLDDSVRIAAALDQYITRVGGELNALTLRLRERLAEAVARRGYPAQTPACMALRGRGASRACADRHRAAARRASTRAARVSARRRQRTSLRCPRSPSPTRSMRRSCVSYSHAAMVAFAPSHVHQVHSECWLESPLWQMAHIVGR